MFEKDSGKDKSGRRAFQGAGVTYEYRNRTKIQGEIFLIVEWAANSRLNSPEHI